MTVKTKKLKEQKQCVIKQLFKFEDYKKMLIKQWNYIKIITKV